MLGPMSEMRTTTTSDHRDHADHGSLKTYAIGFVLSVILTAIPFWLVMNKTFDKSSTTALATSTEAAQFHDEHAPAH